MKIIESFQNDLIKKYAKLSQKKYRDEYGLYIIEGKKNVYDSLNILSDNEIECILVTCESAGRLLSLYTKLESKIIVAEKSILSKVSDYTSETEIIIIANQRDYNKMLDNELCLYLDRIRDPGNLGTILRTAQAAGYGVILDNCCDLFSPKVIRGSMSAIASANISLAKDFDIIRYKENGYAFIGTAASGKNVFELTKGAVKKPLILAIGNEADGLCERVISLCDHLVAIPMEGIESLNAALAAGVLMFEYKYRIL